MTTLLDRRLLTSAPLQHLPASTFPTIHPIHWLTSHFAVGGASSLKRLSATAVDPGGATQLEAPGPGEELFLYVTDGAGRLDGDGLSAPLGQI